MIILALLDDKDGQVAVDIGKPGGNNAPRSTAFKNASVIPGE